MTERSGSSGRPVPFHLVDDRIDRRENGLMTGLFAHRTRSAMLPLEIVKNRSPQDLDRERVVKCGTRVYSACLTLTSPEAPEVAGAPLHAIAPAAALSADDARHHIALR